MIDNVSNELDAVCEQLDSLRQAVASEVAPVYDAVILTCKAYDLDAAVAAIAPAVAPNGYVLPFLNGIAHIDVLNEKFGQHRVLGGTAKIQATITPNGAIRQFNDWRTLAFGEQYGKRYGRPDAFVIFERALQAPHLVICITGVQLAPVRSGDDEREWI